jgi:hypothetical protein
MDGHPAIGATTTIAASLTRRLAAVARATGDEAQADRLQLQIRDLVQLTEAIPAAADPDPHA